MTIAAYSGLPGHGKSYSIVQNVIQPALKAKREIFTNIPLNNEECFKRFQMKATQFNIDDIISNEDWFTEVFTPGAILVIDEVWRLWPAGMKTNVVRLQDKEFLAEHRHLVGVNGLSTEIFLVTQDLSQIAMFARSLVENTYRVSKMSNLGLTKRYRVDVYYGPITGATPPVSKRHREIFGKFEKKIFKLYQSHTKSETGEAGDETRTDNSYNALKGGKVKLFFAVIAFMAFVSYYGLKDLFQFNSDDTASSNQNIPVRTPQQTIADLKQIEYEQSLEDKKAQEVEKHRIAERNKAEFLYSSRHIEIAFNNGFFPKIDYLFKVVFNDNEVSINSDLIQNFGYTVEPIDSCLVKISNDHFTTYAKCYPQKEKEDFFTELTS